MSTRSYQGCWTCKRRRRRCDNARPNCQNCAERGVACEGYEVRLRWGSGIASRGHLTGADTPIKGSAPRPDESHNLEQFSPQDDELVVADEVLFHKFMNDGINALHSTTAKDSIWRRYCQPAAPRYGIEPVSGIPRTLLDIFAGIGAETTEQTFWDWPGESGSFLQCYLWEAHQLAGILAFRRGFRPLLPNQAETSISTWRQPVKCPPDTTVLVTRIMACLDAMRLAFIERPMDDVFIKNATIFPTFVAGSEAKVLCRKPEWQQFIRTTFAESHQCRILLNLLEEIWQKGDPALDIDELARSKELEMGLF
ncbi:hypothetical protein PENANT_c013G01486 [Penicillium antarcticum]|uniref:Zn(2)-C6 fungal-type domain-containing protein n=1 Tax=Penicillium antarcticum TaxID=416450 RepID=A0A1V6Q5Z4_9EURO|nr:hypothetical protein PENANT_c013G01486 [Penicillium antarcticum]